MLKKFDRQQKVQRFFCPDCDRRLWRLHRSKCYQFARETTDFLAVEVSSSITSGSATIDHSIEDDTWLEAFICSKHGRLWLSVTKNCSEQSSE